MSEYSKKEFLRNQELERVEYAKLKVIQEKISVALKDGMFTKEKKSALCDEHKEASAKFEEIVVN